MTSIVAVQRPLSHSLSMNPWELSALDHEFPESVPAGDGTTPVTNERREMQDPMIYPGLYSASGFDLMAILMSVISRPNPQIELGPVDGSVALVLCDLELPDDPIVYASDSFCELTGYPRAEIIGRNCRFLQNPSKTNPSSSQSKPVAGADKVAVQRMRKAVQRRKEVQLQVLNFKKNGQPFANILSIVPIQMEPSGHQYAVGFQVER